MPSMDPRSNQPFKDGSGLDWFLQSERTKQKIPCNCEALQFELETIGPCNCIYRLKWNKEMGSHALLLLAKAHFDIIDL